MVHRNRADRLEVRNKSETGHSLEVTVLKMLRWVQIINSCKFFIA